MIAGNVTMIAENKLTLKIYLERKLSTHISDSVQKSVQTKEVQ
jgi:hypothetical protein